MNWFYVCPFRSRNKSKVESLNNREDPTRLDIVGGRRESEKVLSHGTVDGKEKKSTP